MLFEKLLVGSAATPPTDVGDLFGVAFGGSGQFGNGSTADIGVPAPWTKLDPSSWRQVVSATGGFGTNGSITNPGYSLGIKANGTLWATGNNANGNLGQGNTTNLSTWTQIGSDQWIDVTATSGSAGTGAPRMTSLGIKSDGTLWGWGYNGYYQLGDGTTTQRTSPVQIGSATNWVKVLTVSQNSSGGAGGFTIGITSDGKLWGWGNNVTGSTGQGTTSGSTTTPTQIGTDTNWTDIAVGTSPAYVGGSQSLYSLAVKSTGTLWGFGNNDSYQLGTGTTTSYDVPTQIGAATSWAKVFGTPTGTSFGIRTNGTLYSWGETTASGMTAQGSTSGNVTTPTQVGSATTWSEVSGAQIFPISGGYCLAVMTDSTLWAWGTNASNSFGLGSATPATQSTPLQVGLFPLWKTASAGSSSGNLAGVGPTSLAVRGIPQDYSVLYTFGSNSYGQTAQGTTTGDTLSAKLAASSNYTWEKVAPGTTESGAGVGCVGILKNGTLWGWGSNTAGSGSVSTGSCALGSVLLQSMTPVQVGTDTDWVDIAQGTYGGLGLKSDGTIWGWGYDIWGQFGSGTAGTILYTPTQIGSGTDWAFVATNGVVSFFIKTTGELYTLGNNSGYATGLNTTSGNTVTLTQVGVATNWAKVSISLVGAIAVKTTGQAWSWGTSTKGELGQGAGSISTAVPTQIGSATDWAFVACSAINPFSFLIKTTGTLWSIGENAFYQTGLNTATGNTTTFTQVGSATDWSEVYALRDTTAGGGAGLGIKTTGEVFGWGSAANGLLGNGASSGTQPIPIQLTTGWGSTNAIRVAGNAGPGMVISSV